jgi:hypothetical protein
MTTIKSENTYKNLGPAEKAIAVAREMLPFLLYAAIPILITITIAFVFGPRVGT